MFTQDYKGKLQFLNRLSDLLCEILIPLVRKENGGEKIESTEELLSIVKDVNEKLQKEGL